MHEEYLRRNLQVAKAVGVRGNSKAALERLECMKNPPKWIVEAFEGIHRRSKTLSTDLADWRDTAEDAPEYAAAPDRWRNAGLVKDCQYCEHTVWVSDLNNNREIRCRVDDKAGWPVRELTDSCDKFEQSKDVLKVPPKD